MITINYDGRIINIQLIYYRYEIQVKMLMAQFAVLDDNNNLTEMGFDIHRRNIDAKALYDLVKQNGIRELYIALCDELEVDNSVVPANMEGELL